MAKSTKSEKVPQAMQEKFNRIAAITDDVCKQHLNDEYAQMIRLAIAALCRKKPSPLAKGQDKTWACGITHAIGMVNFLFDSSQSPHISAKDLYQAFGVGQSTGQSKSKLVRDLLKMSQFDPDWCLPSLIDQNPMAWMISFNGFIIDARSASRPVQEIAYAQGLIPYIPGEASPQAESGKPSRAQAPSVGSSSEALRDALYVLSVFLIDGPVTDEFVAANPEVSRVIEIKGSNTLADLHQILFQAFDREDQHMYEFQVGGSGPHDPNARRYGLPPAGAGLSIDVHCTLVADLDLSVDDAFGYWFDFGDDWWHQINVVSIIERAPNGKYPKITQRIGDSPPQYPDFD